MSNLLWSGFTRVYFNAWEDAPRFWSLDQGPGTPELTTETVSMCGADLSTVVNATSVIQPRAWLEGFASVTRQGSTVVVAASGCGDLRNRSDASEWPVHQAAGMAHSASQNEKNV